MIWRAKIISSHHTSGKKPTESYMHCLLLDYFYYRYFGISKRNISESGLLHHPLTEQLFFYDKRTGQSECCHNSSAYIVDNAIVKTHKLKWIDLHYNKQQVKRAKPQSHTYLKD